MGRFDMTSRYDGTLRLTKSELYNELLDEAGPDAADSGMDYDLVKSKFRNSDGNGLEQKLEQIGFDIWEIAGDNPQEKFRALQLLKLLYSIEKDTRPGKKPVYISKALAKPSLDYFQEYLEPLSKIYGDIYKQVDGAQAYEKAFAYVYQDWLKRATSWVQYAYMPELLSKYDAVHKELQMIHKGLKEIWETDPPSSGIRADGVLPAFMLLLMRYRAQSINASISFAAESALQIKKEADAPLADGFLSEYNELDYYVTWDEVGQLYSAIETDFYGLSKKPERVFWAGKMIAMLFGTVLDNDAVSPERKQHRLDALRYAGYLAQVIQQHHIMDVDFSEQIPLHVLAGIVQSIYYVSEHQEKYMISPYRSSKKRSLMATLKSKHKEMDTIEAYTWENIISFRIMTIIGKQEIEDLCNSIQLLTFQVFDKVTSGDSFAQILEKHNFFVSEVMRLEDQVWTDPYLPAE